MTEARGRLAAFVLLAALAACRTVPYTGRHQMLLISPGQEQQMGLQAYEETLKSAKLSTDQEKVSLVRRVGERLAQAADKPDFKWEFNLIEDDKTVNAWCLPGGKVAVYTGLLPVAKDEAGLATVMGHEIAHALARHGAERMSEGMVAQFGGVALNVLMADKPSSAQQLYNAAYGTGVNVGVLLPHSRGQESEADHIGLILMSKAGYDPAAALDFWSRMKQAKGGGGGELEKYLSTHPTDDKRIEDIKKWLPEAQKYRRH